MKRLTITKKFAVWFTVSAIILFYIITMALIPGLNFTIPVVIVTSTGIHLIIALWILLTSLLPTMASILGMEW